MTHTDSKQAPAPIAFAVLALIGISVLAGIRILLETTTTTPMEVAPIILTGLASTGVGIYVLVEIYIRQPLTRYLQDRQDRQDTEPVEGENA